VLSWIDRYGADSSSRKSALSALYLAAGRLISEPFMTTAPSVVHTHHRHVRPRFFKANSKTGNSRRCDRALRSAFKGAPENGKGHLPGWSVETHNWSMEMRSLFRVVKPGISSVLLGSAFFPAKRSFCAGSLGSAPAVAQSKGGWFVRSGSSGNLFAQQRTGRNYAKFQ
jgi:hypothetical protein